MLGRICIGLLAALFSAASLMAAQTGESQRHATDFSYPAKSPDTTFRSNNQGKAVISIPLAPIIPTPVIPGGPVRPAPVPEPLPWRPPISSAPPGFARLIQRAGIIFSGTVIRIQRTSAGTPGESAGTVAITFHVESAIRGTRTGDSLTITQWMGVWSGGQRYRIGERVLLFLYPPSKLGLTSSVGATVGRFAVDPSGRVRLSAQQLWAFRTDPVLGGKSRLRMRDFASAVRRASEEE